MISKGSARRLAARGAGVVSALFAVAVSGLVILGLTLFLSRESIRATQERDDALVAVSAHSAASLLKSDLYEAFLRFRGGSSWAKCRGSGPTDAAAFLRALSAKSGPCAAASVAFPHFKASAGTGSVPVKKLRGLVLQQVNDEVSKINGVSVKITLREIDVRGQRYQIMGSVEVEPRSKSLSGRKWAPMPLSVDGRLTLREPRQFDTSCNLCRPTAGGVCCRDIYRFTVLDGDGHVYDGQYRIKLASLTLTQRAALNPGTVTARNIDGEPHLFKVGDIDDKVIDVVKAEGEIFHLRSDGSILDEHGKRVRRWPALTSFAYFDGLWHFLRSDGAIFTGETVGGLVKQVPGLRVERAEKLVMGGGPG